MIANPLLRSALVLFGSSALLPAATYFTENFSSNTAGPNMAIGSNPQGATTSFAGGNFTITSTTSDARIYLGTNDTNYFGVNFVFQATVTVPNVAQTGGHIAFIGMGSTTPNTGTNMFGEPLTGSNLFMAARGDTTPDRLESRDNATSALAGNTTEDTTIGNYQGGTHLLRMTWNASTQQALFEFDNGNDGSIEGSFTRDGSNNLFTASNSQLVIGGARGLVFDNVSIVPEPSAALLGGLGVLALLRRRR